MIERLRQPEYTGENRCLPCTAVNVVIAIAAGSLLTVATVVTDTAPVAWSLAAGVAVVLVSLALIYLRGYLVPGTPALTKRYMPASVLRLFGKAPAAEQSASPESDVDAEAVLFRAGALEPCADRDDICLSEAFRTVWNDEIDALPDGGVEATTVAETLGLDPGDYTIDEHGDARVIRNDGGFVGKWPSEAALIADVAGAVVLESRLDAWDGYTPEQKGQLLNGLRLFMKDCPTADGGVEFGERTVESCCSRNEVVAVTCEETGERLFEQPLPE